MREADQGESSSPDEGAVAAGPRERAGEGRATTAVWCTAGGVIGFGAGTAVGYVSGVVLGGVIALVAIILGSGLATVTLAADPSAPPAPGDLRIPLRPGLAVATFFTAMMLGAVLGVFLGPGIGDPIDGARVR